MYKLDDPNVRKIVVGKDCYLKDCRTCPYLVKAFWEEKEGVKYGWMGIVCCRNGGKHIDENADVCPNGVAYEIGLGWGMDFDPEDLWTEPPDIIVEGTTQVTMDKNKRRWYNDD